MNRISTFMDRLLFDDDEPGLYERTVDEQIEHYGVYCDTHGELSRNDLSLGGGGKLHCTFCSLNQEMDTRNEHDIDSTVTVGDCNNDSD